VLVKQQPIHLPKEPNFTSNSSAYYRVWLLEFQEHSMMIVGYWWLW